MTSPLVSINITTFNRKDSLISCLEGVFSQTYTNYEVIIVDDFSSDGTGELVERICLDKGLAISRKVKFIRHSRNRGNAAARNTALNACKGKYVAFLDDDDLWIDVKKLERQVRLFERVEKNLAILCTNVEVQNRNGKIVEKKMDAPSSVRHLLLCGNGFIHNSTVMTKREIMIKVGGFSEWVGKGVDSEFFRRCVVRHNYDIYLMENVTTLVNEARTDRMTVLKNRREALRSLWSNVFNLVMYLPSYLKDFKALVIRFMRIAVSFYTLIKVQGSK